MFPLAPLLPFLITGGAQVASNAMANAANVKMADKQMAFQERMRKTQYQTAVADMRAAGLNPALAYSQGGAGTPVGASAEMKGIADNVVSSAKQVQLMKAEKRLIEDQSDKTRRESKLMDDTADRLRSETDLNRQLEGESKSRVRSQELERTIRRFDIPAGRYRSMLDERMKLWGPVLDRVMSVVGSSARSYRDLRGFGSNNIPIEGRRPIGGFNAP